MIASKKQNLKIIICLATALLLASIAFAVLFLQPSEKAGAATATEIATGTDDKTNFTIQEYAAQVNLHYSLQGSSTISTNGAAGSLFGKNAIWSRLADDYHAVAFYNLTLKGDDPGHGDALLDKVDALNDIDSGSCNW